MSAMMTSSSVSNGLSETVRMGLSSATVVGAVIMDDRTKGTDICYFLSVLSKLDVTCWVLENFRQLR